MKVLTPIKAIRMKCIDCCNGQLKEIRLCPCQQCPLWPYRMGRRPTREPWASEATDMGEETQERTT